MAAAAILKIAFSALTHQLTVWFQQKFVWGSIMACLQRLCDKTTNFCRAMLASSAAFAVMQCLSVCLSVTIVSFVKTNKHIIKIFSPSGSHTSLVFLCQMAQQYIDEHPPNGGVEYKGVGKNHDFLPISRFISKIMQDKCKVVWSPTLHCRPLWMYGGKGNLRSRRPPREYLGEYTSW